MPILPVNDKITSPPYDINIDLFKLYNFHVLINNKISKHIIITSKLSIFFLYRFSIALLTYFFLQQNLQQIQARMSSNEASNEVTAPTEKKTQIADQVLNAMRSIKGTKKGTSRQAIYKHLKEAGAYLPEHAGKYNLVRNAMKRLIDDGSLIQIGARYKLSDEAKKVPKKPKAKKPKAEKKAKEPKVKKDAKEAASPKPKKSEQNIETKKAAVKTKSPKAHEA